MCIGCLPNEREREELISKKEKEAKQHAVADQKIYVLYNLPEGGVSYMSADAARAAGITAFKHISHLQQASDVIIS
jgi:hypothetical protein